MLNPFQSLPFVRRIGDNMDFWVVSPSSSYESDIRVGQEYARLAIAFMRETGSPNLLNTITIAQQREPYRSDITVGFWTEISSELIRSG